MTPTPQPARPDSPHMASVSPLRPRGWPSQPQTGHRSIQQEAEDAQRDALWDLLPTLEDFLENAEPFAFLDFAARSLHHVRGDLQSVLGWLRAYGWYESAMFATAMEWLHTGVRPESCMDPDTPGWLRHLDDMHITEAWRQEFEDTTSFVVGLRLPAGQIGAFQARIHHSQGDQLRNYFVLDDPPERMTRLLVSAWRNQPPAYEPVEAQSALTQIAKAVERYGSGPHEPEPANPWPTNRALLDFVLRSTGSQAS